jgi:hypothetical protein
MEVKGTAIAVFPQFVGGRFGAQALEQWLDRLPEVSSAIFHTPVDINRWYPYRQACVDPTKLTCRMFYDGDPKGAWELGRYSAEFALTGVYRSVVKLNTIRLYVERGGVMITEYYRPCSSRTVSVEKGRAVVRIDQFPESHLLVENRIAGWMQRAMEVRGCRRVGVEIARSLAAGDELSEFVITWDEG